MRYVHRITSVVACLLLLWLAATGVLMETVDLYKISTGAPESDATVQSMNAHEFGNPDYSVVTESDLSSQPLPPGFDYVQGFDTLTTALAEQRPGLIPHFAEIRMRDGRPIGQAGYVTPKPFKVYPVAAFDLASKATAAPVALPVIFPVPFSVRDFTKDLHRFWISWDKIGGWVEIFCGIALWVLIVTGLTVYFRLLSFRTKKLKRGQLFWRGGSFWVMFHRWASVAAAVFLVVLATSGTLLGIETAYHSIQSKAQPGATRPLSAIAIRTMARSTLRAFRRDEPATQVRVVRVRYYAGMGQGIVVTDGPPTRQLVYNTSTLRPVELNDPGLPPSKFPFGPITHLTMQRIHSGEIVGLPLIFMNVLAGLALGFLSISGIVVYFSIWRKRATTGRRAFVWK